MKRYFYTLVANAKKTVGANHLGNYAETHLLFNEVVKLHKSVDDWPGFIMTELMNSPNKWIDAKKLKRLQELYELCSNYRKAKVMRVSKAMSPVVPITEKKVG